MASDQTRASLTTPLTSAVLARGRFTLLRRLGSGGSGVVFEAYDSVRREVVAVKTLHVSDATAIHGLKREFRQLADLSHPNLVSLYELIGDDNGEWFLTMELIRGETFLEHVRPTYDTGPPTFNSRRLRDALRQVGAGVVALHRSGKVHRDLKPSNVLVTTEGRAVILDFGIAREIAPLESFTQDSGLAGTIHYLAPELDSDTSIGPAVDVYALGVMLYESLTGQLPFSGNAISILMQKRSKDPPRPSAVAAEVPVDLDELCVAMMTRDPAHRISVAEVLHRLGRNSFTSEASVSGASPLEPRFVGRQHEMAVLTAAYKDAEVGSATRVYVHGPSGIGKSALIRRFVTGAGDTRRPVVLSGRCFDRETVPFKALDGVVDSLVRHLRSLTDGQVAQMLPPDLPIAARLFPALLRVDAVGNASIESLDAVDPVTLRRRAVGAIRELLCRIAERRPVVITIDDLQWGDAESIAVVDDIVRPRDATALLLVCSFRTEDVEHVPFLSELMAEAGATGARVVGLGPLNEDEARELFESIITGNETSEDARNGAIREAAGSPFFLEQLARYALPVRRPSGSSTLTRLIGMRIEELPAGASAVLEVVAVAGHPIREQEAVNAAAIEGDAHLIVSTLRVARLVRSSGSADRIEIYHDRIRETILKRLSPDRVRAIHARLAVSLQELSPADPETLFDHFMRAGSRSDAARQAVFAARKSAEAFAFDRAARFYRYALELGDWPRAEVAQLEGQLGEALTSAGRPGDAAVAFLRAAELVEPKAAREFRGRAGEQLLLGGHNDRGMEVMRALLRDVGLRVPSSPRHALMSFLWQRGRLKVRGVGFRERPAASIPELDLFRMDLCAACAFGLSLTDIIVSSDFQTRFLLMALAAGEPFRASRALGLEAGFAATRGTQTTRHTQHVLDRAQAIADRLGTPKELAFVRMMAGTVAFLSGEWAQAVLMLDEAERVFRDRCSAVMWELAAVQKFSLSSLLFQGNFSELARRVPAYLAEAQERGIPLAENEVQTRLNVRWLAADQPDEATRQVRAALATWSQAGFHRQHYNAYLSLIQADLYRGDGDAAWNAISSQWSTLRRSLLMRVQVLRAEALHLRARAALAVAAQPSRRRAMLAEAERNASALARERARWIQPFASLVRAAIASRERGADEVLPLLHAAITGFDSVGMRLYSAAASRRLGQYAGGDHGRALVAAADAFMTKELIQQPARFAAVLAPGFAIDDS